MWEKKIESVQRHTQRIRVIQTFHLRVNCDRSFE